jgi:hypothetical protein
VNGAENVAKESHILRTLLELDEILIQAGEVFITFD